MASVCGWMRAGFSTLILMLGPKPNGWVKVKAVVRIVDSKRKTVT